MNEMIFLGSNCCIHCIHFFVTLIVVGRVNMPPIEHNPITNIPTNQLNVCEWPWVKLIVLQNVLMTAHLVLIIFFGCFKLFTWNIDSVWGLGAYEWLVFERKWTSLCIWYVWSWESNNTMSSIKLKIFWMCKDFFPLGRLLGTIVWSNLEKKQWLFEPQQYLNPKP
jgi:hypothetical protein